MAIKLQWTNLNQSYTAVDVYRSNSKVGIVHPSNLLASVPPGTHEYIDNTIPVNTSAYYSIVVVAGNGDRITDYPFAVDNFYDFGHGQQKLLRGNFKEGYFGIVPSTQFFTATEVYAGCGLTRGTLNNSQSQWFKFALDDRILYYPTEHCYSGIFWPDLEAIGAHNGTKILTKGNFQYKVSMMAVTAAGGWSGTTPSPLPELNSEYGRLMLPLILTSSLNQPAIQNTGLWSDEPYGNFVKQYAMYRDTDATRFMTHNSNTQMHVFTTYSRTAQTGYIWKPMLELVK